MAGLTRLELATFGVTGRRSNQLSYNPNLRTETISDSQPSDKRGFVTCTGQIWQSMIKIILYAEYGWPLPAETGVVFLNVFQRVAQGWPNETLKEELRTFFIVTFGSLLFALSVTFFVVPAKLPSTGVTGIALFLKYRWGWSLGLTTALMNLALFAYAWKALSKRFLFWSVYATLLISVSFELTALIPPLAIDDPMLLVLTAGVTQGMAFAMVFSTGASTGGMDIVTVAVKRKTGIEVGSISMIINIAILGLFIFEVPIQKVLYGLVMVYVSSQVTNSDLRAFGVRKEAMIVTQHVEMVRKYIVETMHRGVTIFEGKGGFDGRPRAVMISLLSNRQAFALKQFLKQNDPTAFMRLSEAAEVLGTGFRSWRSDI